MMRLRQQPLAVQAWVLVGLLVLVLGAAHLVRETRDRFWKAEQAHQWRTQPLLQTSDGRVLTREELLELTLADFVQRQQAAQGPRPE